MADSTKTLKSHNDKLDQADNGPHTVTNSKAIDRAFKNFAIRHGLKMSEVGKHESRTMDYRTDYSNKKERIGYARKMYGDPEKWQKWAKSNLGQ